MGKRIYVGNLDYGTNEDTLRDLFAQHGEVISVEVMRDGYSGRSRGFGFIEMASDEEAALAISQLNESQVDGRQLKVAEAHPRKQRRRDPLAGLGRRRW